MSASSDCPSEVMAGDRSPPRPGEDHPAGEFRPTGVGGGDTVRAVTDWQPADHDVDFLTLMTLEAHGPDTFVGICEPVPFLRVYGGQVVAQALRAASHTVDPEHHVHSIHGYFIRAGVIAE